MRGSNTFMNHSIQYNMHWTSFCVKDQEKQQVSFLYHAYYTRISYLLCCTKKCAKKMGILWIHLKRLYILEPIRLKLILQYSEVRRGFRISRQKEKRGDWEGGVRKSKTWDMARSWMHTRLQCNRHRYHRSDRTESLHASIKSRVTLGKSASTTNTSIHFIGSTKQKTYFELQTGKYFTLQNLQGNRRYIYLILDQPVYIYKLTKRERAHFSRPATTDRKLFLFSNL